MSNNLYIDAATKPPTFDELVSLIEKNFKDSLLSSKAFTDAEIEASWQRYKALNHLHQDESAGVKGAVWVKATTWPTDHNIVHWRRVKDKRPVLVIGHNYQGNIVAQFGKVYTPQELEWLDETGAPAQSGEEDSVAFHDWLRQNATCIAFDISEQTWRYIYKEEAYTTSQLYDLYIKQKEGGCP